MTREQKIALAYERSKRMDAELKRVGYYAYIVNQEDINLKVTKGVVNGSSCKLQ